MITNPENISKSLYSLVPWSLCGKKSLRLCNPKKKDRHKPILNFRVGYGARTRDLLNHNQTL